MQTNITVQAWQVILNVSGEAFWIICYACPHLGRSKRLWWGVLNDLLFLSPFGTKTKKMSKLFKVCLKLQPTGDLLIQQATVRRNSFITIQGHFYYQFQQNWSKLIKPYQKFSHRLNVNTFKFDKHNILLNKDFPSNF